ncbi:glycerol-3-phosphate dehydrogenase [[Clostridium] aminophilum]|uniref:Glycerol-3-phosphate dehydrogenase n=1 Tax=[Clostridium] aminophilum TaxID=1526 RepID=A0A1I0IBR2_9FIRM|nr:NAD(P)/FAD-dependent oxidoreductase [[Clostridium] aminophilum]SET94235.1 glycerol-3-phosphate dehydrogenase [[Clostridium] aminophilum]
MSEKTYDVVVIGGGVIGSSIARELSRYQCDVLLVEKEEDVCSGTSKANSAIVHAGFDAKPNTQKAEMNVRGNEIMGELSEQLDFAFRRNGSMVLCFDKESEPALKELYDRGVANGVKGLELLTGDQARAKEPNLEDTVTAALWAPTGGIVDPFELTIAMAENAADNGVEFRFNTGVENVEKTADGYRLTTNSGMISTKYVVNAAGVYSDKIHNMVSEKKLSIKPRRGEYMLLDKNAGGLVDATIFQLPTKLGKGILVTPTVHGNILLGPTAVDQEDKEATNTTPEGLEDVQAKAALSVKGIPVRQVITSFSGLRAHEAGDDFIIGECPDAEGFFDAAGIESPGLTSAPAIGEYLAGLIAEKEHFTRKADKDFIATRRGVIHAANLSSEERAELIRKNPAYGMMVCRCEMISEGEIVDAIRRTLGARSMDGIKRRTRQGMGRCQAGFCTPRAMEILSRETGIPMEEICKNRKGSELIKG